MNSNIETSIGHTHQEIANIRNTFLVLDGWIAEPGWPSRMVIAELHKSLLSDVADYEKKGIVPSKPGVYRESDLENLSRGPKNFYVRALDVPPVMDAYCRRLDAILSELPEKPLGNLSKIVKDAAWAYYCFIRIHPFYDGNGRTGRNILNRVLEGGGIKRLVFLEEWYERNREGHLDAMISTDNLGSTLPIELYILRTLKENQDDEILLSEVDQEIMKVSKLVETHEDNGDGISNIWDVFRGLDIDGNGSRSELQLQSKS